MARRGKKPSTLGQVRNVLASALREAERLDMIARSPLDKLRGALPIGDSPAAQPADKAAVDRTLAETPVNDPNRIALLLALACGLRRGEICGLRWRAVSLSRRRNMVAREKSRSAASWRKRCANAGERSRSSYWLWASESARIIMSAPMRTAPRCT